MAKATAASSSWVWFLSVAALIHTSTASASSRCYSAIYSFGDSIADTGNLYYDTEDLSPSTYLVLDPPYGDTFFHFPTGRFSDGRLIIDFLAEQIGVPLLKPYLGIKKGKIKDWNSLEGVNFAVGGATALDISFFVEKGLYDVLVPTNYSLGVQFDWFMDLLPSICNSSSGCKQVFGSSLFLVGEIGGNDFNYLFFLGRPIEEATTYVPLVINKISWAINELINLGAVTLMVPGSIPLGCNPAYLTLLASPNKEEYDEAGCLKWLNKFYGQHNELLQIELDRLRVLYPHVNIIYADYFNAALRFYRSPQQFGFCRDFIKVCCGGGGPYNFNETAVCGEAGAIACDDPSEYIYWDGYHFTEAAYRWMAKALFHGPYTFPKFSFSCITPETSADFNNHSMI
ncbi:hypothetical protein AHAS_Ahas20G0067000 [Arachis hypogaea]